MDPSKELMLGALNFAMAVDSMSTFSKQKAILGSRNEGKIAIVPGSKGRHRYLSADIGYTSTAMSSVKGLWSFVTYRERSIDGSPFDCRRGAMGYTYERIIDPEFLSMVSRQEAGRPPLPERKGPIQEMLLEAEHAPLFQCACSCQV